MTTAPTVDPADLVGPYLRLLIERMRSIPDEERDFSADVNWAAQYLTMPVDVLEILVQAGLPVNDVAGERRFDPRDLVSASYAHGGRSTYRDSMRLWARQLRSLSEAAASYSVRYVGSCPEPGHPGSCDWEFRASESGFSRHDDDDSPEFSFTVLRPPPSSRASEHIAALFDRYADVSFHALPPALRNDTTVVRELHLAECSAMARTIVEDAAAFGIEARTAFGLIVATPFSSSHTWVEFRVDDKWIPYDPFLIRTMQAWNVRGAEDLDPHMALDGFVLRLAAEPGPLVLHRGNQVKAALPTQRRLS